MVVPQGIVAGADFMTETLATAVTVSVAFAAVALLPALVVNAPIAIVFAYAPAVAAVTSIWTVQLPFAGTMPPVSVTLPGKCVTIPPAQVVDPFGVLARTKPAPGKVGKVSVTLVTEMGPTFGLMMVMVSVETPPEAIGFAANALLMVGGVALTVKFTLVELTPVGASRLVTPVATLGCNPGVLLRITINTVQVPLAGIVSAVKLSKPV